MLKDYEDHQNAEAKKDRHYYDHEKNKFKPPSNTKFVNFLYILNFNIFQNNIIREKKDILINLLIKSQRCPKRRCLQRKKQRKEK